MNLAEYFEEVKLYMEKYPHQRCGQAAFNVLHRTRLDLADKVYITDSDPFYASDEDDPRWKRFVEFLILEWDR